MDTVRLLINWPDDSISAIEFYDCYAFTANMNFGIVANESILNAKCFTNSKELISIRNEWAKGGVDLENLQNFNIITNSTNSVIDIFALGFRIIEI